MSLEELGYNASFEQYRINNNLQSFEVGRVVVEHKEKYLVRTLNSEYQADLTGKLRFTAETRSDFPAVGDWVAITLFDENNCLIHEIFPRTTTLTRKSIGKASESQIIATNIDYGIIVTAIDSNFNINRIERYLTICNSSNIQSIIILNKIDLIDTNRQQSLLEEIHKRIIDTPIILISSVTLDGIDILKDLLIKGKTYCLLGSSGVGKSTLLNTLAGDSLMKTGSLSFIHNKGKHITTHRELFVLENGIIIDNPGMREIGLIDGMDGLDITFDEIVKLSFDCKFRNCSHIEEKGCAVLEAVHNERISKESYNNFLKMRREKIHFESSTAEKRKKDKQFGKMIKTVIQYKKKF